MSIIEVISHPLFLGSYVFSMALLILIVFSAKYALFGFNAFFKKSSGKYALVFLRLPDGNISFPPLFHPLEKSEIEIKKKGVKKIFPLHRNDFKDGKFFGFSYVIKDSDDAVRSYGLYAEDFKEIIDEKTGESSFETVCETVNATDDNGKVITVQTNIPKMIKEKAGFRVDPEIIDGLISKNSILSSIKDLFAKHNLMFVALIVVGVLVLVGLYLGYENMTMIQQQLIPAIESIKGQLAEQAANSAGNVPTQNIPLQ